ncbi:MAG: glycogen/starch synthase, partial [Cyanobacteria bacterium]|nr:glycogen/starch synthase [Cyanobacteriota bacterium]
MSQLGISLHSIRATGHHLATQSLATGSNASPVTASSLAHDPLNTHPGQVLYFSGKGIQQTGKNGLWITTELAPYAIVGGLGQVSETIPEALNEYLGKDVRVMVPMLSPLVNHPDFQDTGVSTQVEGPGGTVETFKVFQRNQPGKPIIYAIANDKLFGAHKNLYFPREQAVLPVGNDAIFKLITLFNKAAAQLAPLLNQESVNDDSLAPGGKGAKPNGLAKFNGNADFVMVHDWLTSPFLSELNSDYRSSVGKVFMLHNTFNEARDLDYAFKEIGMTPPVFEKPATRYSPLHIGVEMS